MKGANKSVAPWLAVGLVAACLGQNVAVSQTASIHDIQLNVTPNRNLSHTYFFFYYHASIGCGGTSDVAVKRIGNLTANVPFSQTLELPPLPQWTSASYGLIGLNDGTSGIVTVSFNSDEAAMLTNSPILFEDVFPGWNESDIATALLNDDTNVLREFGLGYPNYWTSFLPPGSSAALINFTNSAGLGTPATDGGAISALPVLTNNLSLQLQASDGGLQMSWPAAATNYWMLEVSSNLASWDVVTNGIGVLGDFCLLQVDMSNPAAFYRLRRY